MSEPQPTEAQPEQPTFHQQAAADYATAQSRAAEGQMQLATSPCTGGPQ